MDFIFKHNFFGLSIYRIGHFHAVRTWRPRIFTIKLYKLIGVRPHLPPSLYDPSRFKTLLTLPLLSKTSRCFYAAHLNNTYHLLQDYLKFIEIQYPFPLSF